MRKEFKGWLGGDFDDLGFYPTKEDAERGMMPGENALHELLEKFKGKKVRLVVEEIED